MTKSSCRKERLVTSLIWLCVLLISAVFFWIFGEILWNGGSKLTFDFLTLAPKQAGRGGGIGPILISTLWIVGVAMAVSIPLGVGAAILLSEFKSSENIFILLIRRSLDVLAGVPSIVFGLFGNAFFCKTLGLGFSILSGGLTLACMVLPILIRSTEEGFRSVPEDYHLSAAALGLSRISTLWNLLLPAAVPGLIVGIVLGVGRAMAETAALIFTSGYVDRMPTSFLDSGRSLSIHIFDLSMNVSGGDPNAYRSAFVLMLILVLINALASFTANYFFKRRIITV